MFLNGLGAIRFQAVCAVCMGIAALALKIILTGRFGLAGIAWGTIIGYTICTAIPMAFFVPRVLRHLQRHPVDHVSTADELPLPV